MEATRQIFWTLMVLAAGFLCMTLRALVDKHTDAPAEALSLFVQSSPVCLVS
jgi:hypothetical protein